jgi:hypothetical protein
MALSNSILGQIRAEIGDQTVSGVDDDMTIETIYEDTGRGNSSVKMTAWYVWKRRLSDLQSRSFDVTTGGALLSRSQRVRHIQTRIAELEFAIGAENLGRFRGENQDLQTTYQTDEASDTEFS